MHHQPIRTTFISFLIACVTHNVLAHEADTGVVRSGALQVAIDSQTGAIERLDDVETGLSWRNHGSQVFRVDAAGQGLTTTLTVKPSHSGEVVLTLTLHNPSEKTVTTGVHFPQLEGLSGGDAAELQYCFPQQGLVLGSQPIEIEQAYSSRFPLQFVTACQPGKGGVYAMTCDTTLLRKSYRLKKDQRLHMAAYYPALIVEPGQTLELPPARIGVYTGDWHEAFEAYRRWTKEWYEPTSIRKRWFREVFHFRQVFLYPNLDTPGLYDVKNKTLSIHSSIEKDLKDFGSIDYVHLFDWSQTPDQGRVGMYAPWHHLPREVLSNEIGRIQESGRPVGLYFEGYLVSPAAEIVGRPDRSWQLLNSQAGRYDPFGSGDDYLCPAVSGWRDYLMDTVQRVSEQTSANGFYIDQFGFGYQYPCYDPSHGHSVPSNQPLAEAELIQDIRQAMNDEDVLYTEQTPVDIAMQYQDGSFSYSLLHARNPQSPSRINLTRFAFPDFKTIQILKGDGPIGDDVQGVELVFYNGDGLWLVGPSDSPKWYSPAVLEAIRKTGDLRKQYLDAFTSNDVTPLVPTAVEDVYANRFRSEKQTVWTLYNAGQQQVDGVVLRVRHHAGASYHDAWNQQDLIPKIDDGWAYLSLRLDAGAVGCVVMSGQ